ncbi:MAG: helix-turn-helix domain-containing protein [Thermoplasmatota archaeon]
MTETDERGSLGHPTRKVLYRFITENPGTSFQFILNVMKIPEGTLRYHLEQLQRSRRIVSEKKGRNLVYYSTFHRDHPECHADLDLNVSQKLLLDLIRDSPGATRKELLARSRLGRRELNYSLRRLGDLKLIWKVDTEDGQGYEVISKDRFKDEMFRILVDRLLSGEMDLERFRLLKDRLEKM